MSCWSWIQHLRNRMSWSPLTCSVSQTVVSSESPTLWKIDKQQKVICVHVPTSGSQEAEFQAYVFLTWSTRVISSDQRACKAVESPPFLGQTCESDRGSQDSAAGICLLLLAYYIRVILDRAPIESSIPSSRDSLEAVRVTRVANNIWITPMNIQFSFQFPSDS